MTLAETVEFANRADQDWKEYLADARIDRWSPSACGAPNSGLRAVYDAKVAADKLLSAAFEASRKAVSP